MRCKTFGLCKFTCIFPVKIDLNVFVLRQEEKMLFLQIKPQKFLKEIFA